MKSLIKPFRIHKFMRLIVNTLKILDSESLWIHKRDFLLILTLKSRVSLSFKTVLIFDINVRMLPNVRAVLNVYLK